MQIPTPVLTHILCTVIFYAIIASATKSPFFEVIVAKFRAPWLPQIGHFAAFKLSKGQYNKFFSACKYEIMYFL